MRRILAPLFAVVLGVALNAPQGARAETIVISVGRAPYSAPFYVAEAEGFFKAEDVDVRIEDCPFGRICLERMIKGNAHLATVAETPIVLAGLAGIPMSVVATTGIMRRDVKIIARRSGTVRSPVDLAGKRVGTFVGTSAHYFLHLALLLGGGDPADIKLVALKPDDDMAAMLRSGDLDAIAVVEPFGYRVAQALGDDAKVFTNSAFAYAWNLVASPAFAQTNVAAIERVLRALDRAMTLIQKNPEKAKNEVKSRLQMTDAEIAWSWAGISFNLTLDRSLVMHLEGQARWALRFGYATGSVPAFSSFLDAGPLSRLRPDLRLR